MLLISNTGSVGSSALTSLRTDDAMAFAARIRHAFEERRRQDEGQGAEAGIYEEFAPDSGRYGEVDGREWVKQGGGLLAADSPALDALYRQRVRVPRPARTTVVAALMNAQYRVEMTFIAASGGHRAAVSAAAQADALASPAVVAGSRVFLSARDGVDRAGAADVEAQTSRAAARPRRAPAGRPARPAAAG